MDDPTFEDQIYDARLSRILFLLGIVILSYEHILTFPSELEYIWPTRRSFSSAWFLCIRYFSLCSNIVVIVDTFGTFSYNTCNALNILIGFQILVQEFMVGYTICLRIYAMYGLSKKLLMWLACVGVLALAVTIWAIVPQGPNPTVDQRAPGCYLPQSKETDYRFIGAWAVQLLGDFIALFLILYRAYTHGGGAGSPSGSLWSVIIRDGIVYFAMISLANLANILMFYFGDLYTSTGLAWLTSVISVAMILRLIINLHHAASYDATTFGGTLTDPLHFVSDARAPQATRSSWV